MSVSWVFDPAPPSGRRTGGSAAEYSFEGRIDVLVREVVQNALDARHGEEAVEVRFRVVDLSGGPLQTFLSAINWKGLVDNLEAVPKPRGGQAISKGVDRVHSQRKLRLLIVEDRGTRGLSGTEQRLDDTTKNPFCALVRDELYSDKDDPSSGGSFGLGKSVLWAYSSLKTVLFSSVPVSPPPGRKGLRFIGRAALPWHETKADGRCSGDGWLGTPVDIGKPGRHADSVWGAEAGDVAEAARCVRETQDYGLSAVIVGFSEPGEEDREPAELMGAIAAASTESFWPAMIKGDLRVAVATEENDDVVEERVVRPEELPGFRELGALLDAFTSGALDTRSKLEPGQSAMAWVKLEVPKRLLEPAHPEMTAKAAVLVHLFEPGREPKEVVDRIFRFRGPGMVIRSERRGNLSLAARPYVAAVLAGTACGSDAPQEAAEAFLRAAEPPAHDEWTHNTRRVKQEYQAHGAKAKLERFETAVRTAITNLISKPEEKGGQLPKALLQYLRFSDSGGGGNPRFISVTHSKAEIKAGTWHFQARCRRVHPDDRPWHVVVRLKYSRDGGGGDDVHAISEIVAEGASRQRLAKGVGYLEFPPTVDQAKIVGRTASDLLPGIGTRAAIQLKFDGATGGLDDA